MAIGMPQNGARQINIIGRIYNADQFFSAWIRAFWQFFNVPKLKVEWLSILSRNDGNFAEPSNLYELNLDLHKRKAIDSNAIGHHLEAEKDKGNLVSKY